MSFLCILLLLNQFCFLRSLEMGSAVTIRCAQILGVYGLNVIGFYGQQHRAQAPEGGPAAHHAVPGQEEAEQPEVEQPEAGGRVAAANARRGDGRTPAGPAAPAEGVDGAAASPDRRAAAARWREWQQWREWQRRRGPEQVQGAR